MPLTPYHVHIQRWLLPEENKQHPNKWWKASPFRTHRKKCLDKRLATVRGREVLWKKLIRHTHPLWDLEA